MEYIDRLENFYGEAADVYERDDGAGVIILEGSRKQHIFNNVETAINKLYKMGYRF